MQGSGLNHNQNHIVGNRITSRVLQPPGGASSLCLGASEPPRRSAPANPSFSYVKNDTAYTRFSGEREKPHYGRGISDSLDDEIQATRSRKGSSSQEERHPPSNYSRGKENVGTTAQTAPYRGGQQSRFSTTEYAELLRQQIDEKKNFDDYKITSVARRSDSSSSRKYPDEYSEQSQPNSRSSSRGRARPAASLTTFSIGWQ